MLCRQHGATCAYTPMLHSRLFVEDQAYRQALAAVYTYYICTPSRESHTWRCAEHVTPPMLSWLVGNNLQPLNASGLALHPRARIYM
jgi:hypothetical protein